MSARSTQIYVSYVQPLIAEFFGQLIFAFLHCSTAATNVKGDPLTQGVSDGLTVAILVIIIGKISGAQVNFAVTTAVFIGGGIKYFMVPFYLIFQILGSLAGAALAYVANGEIKGYFGLAGGISIGQGILMETMTTALLTLAVLMAAVELSSINAAFAIGFAILIDILASYTVTGGCMNPSLSIGPAVVSGVWKNYWIYWVGPLLGAIISGLIFRLFLGGRSRLLFKDESDNEEGSQDVEKEPGPSNR